MGAFDAEKFRAFHRSRGERYRWFRSMPAGTENVRGLAEAGRDGRVLTEQTLPQAARALVHAGQHEVRDEEFGLFPQGSLMISVMPDESYLERLDRIVLPERRLVARETCTRSANESDTFARAPVVYIREVRRGAALYRHIKDFEATETGLAWQEIRRPETGVAYFYGPGVAVVRGADDADELPAMSFAPNAVYDDSRDYEPGVDFAVAEGVVQWLGATRPAEGASYTVAELEETERGEGDRDEPDGVDETTVVKGYRKFWDWDVRLGGIYWFPAHPVAGEVYAVEYGYNPTYLFLRTQSQPPRPDKNGVLMPLRGLLVERLPGG